jgi:hypothetical protein
MEVGQGPNWGYSAKEKKNNTLDAMNEINRLETVLILSLVFCVT